MYKTILSYWEWFVSLISLVLCIQLRSIGCYWSCQDAIKAVNRSACRRWGHRDVNKCCVWLNLIHSDTNYVFVSSGFMITATVAVISVTGSCCASFVYGNCLIFFACIYRFYLKNHCILVVDDNATNFRLHALECL